MSRESNLQNTTCSKGHIHPSWNTSGILRIARCESVCGFCQKEMKNAANLRKHVAVHIKNETLNLNIAEGSSGRGRLNIPIVRAKGSAFSSSRISLVGDDESMDIEVTSTDILTSTARENRDLQSPDYSLQNYMESSPSAVFFALKQSQPSHSIPLSQAIETSPTAFCNLNSNPSPPFTVSLSTSQAQSPSLHPYDNFSHQEFTDQNSFHRGIHEWSGETLLNDPYKDLRKYNIGTRPAWTAIPASEGFRILDVCKSMSTAASASEGKVPCYNRETLFDEEWQAHMKDIHGVFLLWPQTWMRRIEVLDLDDFGGDIVGVNEVIMNS